MLSEPRRHGSHGAALAPIGILTPLGYAAPARADGVPRSRASSSESKRRSARSRCRACRRRRQHRAPAPRAPAISVHRRLLVGMQGGTSGCACGAWTSRRLPVRAPRARRTDQPAAAAIAREASASDVVLGQQQGSAVASVSSPARADRAPGRGGRGGGSGSRRRRGSRPTRRPTSSRVSASPRRAQRRHGPRRDRGPRHAMFSIRATSSEAESSWRRTTAGIVSSSASAGSAPAALAGDQLVPTAHDRAYQHGCRTPRSLHRLGESEQRLVVERFVAGSDLPNKV